MDDPSHSAASAPVRLLGDIGGTNVRFGIVEAHAAAPTRVRTFPGARFAGPEQAIRHYLALEAEVQVAECVLSVANPVCGDELRLTNRHWSFSVAQLRAALGLQRLQVINDFSALALALPGLAANEVRQVGGGEPVAGGALAVLGPGTGLGVSGLLRCGEFDVPLAGEGGHVSMPARNARESEVLARVAREFGHASAERVLSGPGLEALYGALRMLDHLPPQTRPAAEISLLAIRDENRHCSEALDLFCALLGTVAADLALVLGARGGVFIGGGIVPQLGEYFAQSRFRARFEDKGRFSAYLAAIPTYVVVAPYATLNGAARAATLPFALGYSARAADSPPA